MHRDRPGSHWVGHNLVEADDNVDAAQDELLRSQDSESGPVYQHHALLSGVTGLCLASRKSIGAT